VGGLWNAVPYTAYAADGTIRHKSLTLLCESFPSMTYCLAIALDSGLVFASDSRTHAGVDYISTYRKTHTFVWEGERVFVLLSAGNLATTQAVVKQMHMDVAEGAPRNLQSLSHMHQVAEYIGKLSIDTQNAHRGEGPAQQGVSFEATFILGGQIKGHEPELYLIYPQGNYISVSPDQPFFQIGETKYGKPILDRIIERSVSLEVAARCALVSLDSTMRSNLSVGPPIDLVLYRRDSLKLDRTMRLEQNSPYLEAIRRAWSEGLRHAFDNLPELPDVEG